MSLITYHPLVSISLFPALFALLCIGGCEESMSGNSCDPGAKQRCTCNGNIVGYHTCAANGEGWNSCLCVVDAGAGADMVGDVPMVPDTVAPMDTAAVADMAAVADTAAIDTATAKDQEVTPDVAAPDSGSPAHPCNIGGVCNVFLAPDPSLSFTPVPGSYPNLVFNQHITDDRWGTIHLFWFAAGAWHEKAIEQLPDASKYGGQKWQLVRGIDYVCPGDGPMPSNWIPCGTNGCSVVPLGETVYYAVVDNDGATTKYTMRTEAMPYVWDFVRIGCEP